MTSSFRLHSEARRPGFVPALPPGEARDFASQAAAGPPPVTDPDGAAAETPAPGPPAPDVDALVRQAYEEGVAAGRAELPWQEAEALTQATAALEEAAGRVRDQAVQLQRAGRAGLIELALAIAERVLERELRAQTDSLAPIVNRALELLSEQGELEIRLAPSDLAVIGRGEAPEIERLARDFGARLVADAELAGGEARVRGGDAAVVTARLDDILQRFREELTPLTALEGDTA